MVLCTACTYISEGKIPWVSSYRLQLYLVSYVYVLYAELNCTMNRNNCMLVYVFVWIGLEVSQCRATGRLRKWQENGMKRKMLKKSEEELNIVEKNKNKQYDVNWIYGKLKKINFKFFRIIRESKVFVCIAMYENINVVWLCKYTTVQANTCVTNQEQRKSICSKENSHLRWFYCVTYIQESVEYVRQCGGENCRKRGDEVAISKCCCYRKQLERCFRWDTELLKGWTRIAERSSVSILEHLLSPPPHCNPLIGLNF